MSQKNITRVSGSQVKIDFVVTPDEAKPYLDQAVIDISTHSPLKGFRPGKATYENIARAYGEMKIWQQAFEKIARAQFMSSALAEDLDTIGTPSLEMEKLVPGNNIEFSMTVDILPSVERLADYSKTLLKWKPRVINEKDIADALKEMQNMHRVEVVADHEAKKEDLVVVDLDILKDNVLIEGGTSRGFKVYMNEAQYIPGFSDKLLGVKSGEERNFELPFPEDHFNKMLAGQQVKFNVTVKDIYELQLPDVNDAFAKKLGIDSLDTLKELLKKNIQDEANKKTDQSCEIELMDILIAKSAFSQIPELLINEEVRRMLLELEKGVDDQGMKMEDYLVSIKKTKDQLRVEFIPQAIKRIQSAILLKEIGKQEKCAVAEKDVDTEIDRILETIKQTDTETRERVSSPEYREYITSSMKNRNVLHLLKTKVVEGYPSTHV